MCDGSDSKAISTSERSLKLTGLVNEPKTRILCPGIISTKAWRSCARTCEQSSILRLRRAASLCSSNVIDLAERIVTVMAACANRKPSGESLESSTVKICFFHLFAPIVFPFLEKQASRRPQTGDHRTTGLRDHGTTTPGGRSSEGKGMSESEGERGRPVGRQRGGFEIKRCLPLFVSSDMANNLTYHRTTALV